MGKNNYPLNIFTWLPLPKLLHKLPQTNNSLPSTNTLSSDSWESPPPSFSLTSVPPHCLRHLHQCYHRDHGHERRPILHSLQGIQAPCWRHVLWPLRPRSWNHHRHRGRRRCPCQRTERHLRRNDPRPHFRRSPRPLRSHRRHHHELLKREKKKEKKRIVNLTHYSETQRSNELHALLINRL